MTSQESDAPVCSQAVTSAHCCTPRCPAFHDSMRKGLLRVPPRGLRSGRGVGGEGDCDYLSSGLGAEGAPGHFALHSQASECHADTVD